jgi:hypothetical protein
MRFLVGIGELIAVVGALGAIARLALWGIQWGRKRAHRKAARRSKTQRVLSEVDRSDSNDEPRVRYIR